MFRSKKLLPFSLLLISAISAAQTSIDYSYDKNGRLIMADDGTRQIIYSYDSNGNLLQKQYANSGTPFADIQANNSDGPIQINQATPVQLKLNLQTNKWLSKSADWWLVMQKPSGKLAYYDLTQDIFVDSSTTLNNTYQGSLFNLDNLHFKQLTELTPGDYIFYFGVDNIANNQLDFDQLEYDQVQVNISPSN